MSGAVALVVAMAACAITMLVLLVLVARERDPARAVRLGRWVVPLGVLVLVLYGVGLFASAAPA